RAQEIALSQFGSSFTQDDYGVRVDRLLWRDDRAEAERWLSRLLPGDRAVAAARIALQGGRLQAASASAKAPKGESRPRRPPAPQPAAPADPLRGVPDSRLNDPGLLYDRARAVRRAGRPEDALAIAAQISPMDAPAAARETLFEERRLYVPRALRMGQAQTAF